MQCSSSPYEDSSPAAAIHLDLAWLGAFHQAELDREPEEARHRLYDARHPPHPFLFVAKIAGPLGRGAGALAEEDQRVRKRLVRVHRHVAGDVVEDVRLGEIVEHRAVANRDRRGKLALAQAIEEHVRRYVAAHRLCPEARSAAP